jgi:hypothetical protein
VLILDNFQELRLSSGELSLAAKPREVPIARCRGDPAHADAFLAEFDSALSCVPDAVSASLRARNPSDGSRVNPKLAAVSTEYCQTV